TVAAGCYADHWIALVDRDRLVKMRARAIVLATGCFEQPAVFGNNDLPGIMLASAAQRLTHLYAVRPFERGSGLVAHGDGYRAALDLHAAGVKLEAVIDLRPEGEASELTHNVRRLGITVFEAHAVTKANAGPGKSSIRGVEVCPLDDRGKPDASRK